MQSEYSIYEMLLSQVMSLPKPIRRRLARTVLADELPDESITPLPQESLVYKEPKYNVDSTTSMNWLSRHRAEYGGQWVALDGDRLIAHGPNAKEVFALAKADGAHLPLITYIEPVDAPPFIF